VKRKVELKEAEAVSRAWDKRVLRVGDRLHLASLRLTLNRSLPSLVQLNRGPTFFVFYEICPEIAGFGGLNGPLLPGVFPEIPPKPLPRPSPPPLRFHRSLPPAPPGRVCSPRSWHKHRSGSRVRGRQERKNGSHNTPTSCCHLRLSGWVSAVPVHARFGARVWTGPLIEQST
jgi:hypothetical protein